jgi:hypothetical protein
MDDTATTPTTLVTALALAQEHAGAAEALRHTGLDLDGAERVDGLPEELERWLASKGDDRLAEALALGFLAGRVAHRPRPRHSLDPTSFLMDHDLVVRGAEGRWVAHGPRVSPPGRTPAREPGPLGQRSPTAPAPAACAGAA